MAVQNGFCYIFLVPRMNEWENTEVGELSMGMWVPEKLEVLEICTVFPLRLLGLAFSCQWYVMHCYK